MTTAFPGALDTLTNPVSTDQLSSPPHAGQHEDANDALEAIEAKVGIDGSAVTSSHDYKVSNVTGTLKALAGPASPANWRVLYQNGSGVITELVLGASGTFLRSEGATSAPTFASVPAGHVEDHAARHDENAADEIFVEDLGATSSDTSTALRPNGTGGLVFSDINFSHLLGTISDTQHGTVGVASAHGFAQITGTISNAQHGTVSQASAHGMAQITGSISESQHGALNGPNNAHDMVDMDAANNRMFYSLSAGVAELAHGASGDVLTSQGTTSAPAWVTPVGGRPPIFHQVFS